MLRALLYCTLVQYSNYRQSLAHVYTRTTMVEYNNIRWCWCMRCHVDKNIGLLWLLWCEVVLSTRAIFIAFNYHGIAITYARIYHINTAFYSIEIFYPLTTIYIYIYMFDMTWFKMYQIKQLYLFYQLNWHCPHKKKLVEILGHFLIFCFLVQ